jgi:acyl-coenzyme A thioesterase PaaI-like protein
MSTVDFKKQREPLTRGAKVAPIVKTFGMRLEYNEKNEAVGTLPFNENLTNEMIIHGGAVATLIDNAGWFAIRWVDGSFEMWLFLNFSLPNG